MYLIFLVKVKQFLRIKLLKVCEASTNVDDLVWKYAFKIKYSKMSVEWKQIHSNCSLKIVNFLFVSSVYTAEAREVSIRFFSVAPKLNFK